MSWDTVLLVLQYVYVQYKLESLEALVKFLRRKLHLQQT